MKTVLLFTGVFLIILPVVVPVHELHSVQQMGLGIVFCVGLIITVTGVTHILEDAFKKPKEQKEKGEKDV